MKCPRCVQKVTPGEESCPHCGYSMAVACGFYGERSVVAGQLMDVESRLTEDERSAIKQSFAGLTALFPQLFFMMYLGALPPPASPRQFAFWLLNHAAVQEVEWLPNERGLLLLVDPRTGSAVLASGYFLENFISQAELDAVLRSGWKELGRADYAGAVHVIATSIGSLLKQKARESARHPERFRPPVEPPRLFPPLPRTGKSVMGEAAPMGKITSSSRVEAEPAAVKLPAAAPSRSVRRLKPGARRNPPRRS